MRTAIEQRELRENLMWKKRMATRWMMRILCTGDVPRFSVTHWQSMHDWQSSNAMAKLAYGRDIGMQKSQKGTILVAEIEKIFDSGKLTPLKLGFDEYI